MKYKLSKYCIITKSSIEDIHETKIVYSTRSGKIILLENKTIKKLKAGHFHKISEKLLEKLIFFDIIVPLDEDELQTVLSEFTSFTMDNKSLGIVIAPSANCQLGCEYCGQIHSKLNLTGNLLKKIFSHVKNKLEEKEYDRLSITWYGAEPLMGIKSIENLSNQWIALCNIMDISYYASMITNGLNLNLRTFNKLATLKVNDFQITIDGIRETHNSSRYTKRGLPTFDIIINNIKNAVNTKIYALNKMNITIRINIHLNNYEEIENFLYYLHKEKIQNKITISFAMVHDWGNNFADKKIGLSFEKFSELEIDWFLKMKELGFRDDNTIIPNRVYNTCMTTTNDSELIDAKGNISYCWEVPYTPGFESDKNFVIGNLNTKNTYTKNYYKNPPLRDWYNDIKSEKYNSHNCNECEFLPVCGGSCPISWYKGVPACPSFKFNMEDRLFMHFLDCKT